MKRVLALDYGLKKTGIAVTDPLRIFARGLETIDTPQLFEFLDGYMMENELEAFVLGEPFFLDGSPAQHHSEVMRLAEKLRKKYPDIPIHFQDETNTSKRAKAAILQSGAKKKKRRDKKLVDKISAVIILQDWLEDNRQA